MGVDDQPGFDPRLAWAAQGGTRLALACPVLVVVDVLRFTTAVEVAVTSGARVVPERWPGAGSPAGAGEEPGRRVFSLSPASLAEVAAGTRVVLASPNGATVSLAVAEAGAVVLAGCLRNASAVAAAARDLGGPVGVVAAGELRHDGSLRPAVEDLIGAGAVLHALGGHPSPEPGPPAPPSSTPSPTCRPSWPAAPPAASWPPAAWPPTSAWRLSTTSAGRSPAWRAGPSLS